MKTPNMDTEPLLTKFKTESGEAFVLQFGLPSAITEDVNCFANNNISRAIMVVPGNPGCIHFYKNFMKKLYAKYQIPVFGVSHSGCARDAEYNGNNTVQEKVLEKENFIKKYIPPETKLIIIGQSLGSFVVLKMMKNDKIRNQTEHIFLLTPALDRINESMSYYWVYFIGFPLRFAFYPLLYLLSLCPEEKVEKILSFVGLGAASSLSSVPAVENCIQLAYDEFKQIIKRDDETLRKITDKCSLLYAKYDEWVPSACYKDIINSYEKLDAVIWSDIVHAFVSFDSQCDRVVSFIADRFKA